MKKTIYIAGSTSIVILLVMFYFHSVSSNTSNDMPVDGNQNFNQDFIQNVNNQSSFSPQSGGWQLQVMPDMGSRLVRDLYFTDSLTGYAVASPESVLDSSHILKTTNGGINWLIKATYVGNLPRITFLNANTGFAGGNFLFKTTNAGENWVVWNWGPDRIIYDMQVFSEDTIWYADRFSVGGGLFLTTNGGVNWEKRDSGIPANSYPDRIYFYNSRIGFARQYGINAFKTTNGGLNWFQTNYLFTDINFKDSLNGWRALAGMYRTSDGGLSWSQDSLPKVQGNIYTENLATDFINVNNQILYAYGGSIYYYGNGRYKAFLYKSTNGGQNWGYQIPDTNYNFFTLLNGFSYNKNNIWLHSNKNVIYSSTGGDSTVYLGINQITNEVPNDYELEQNYPNPFNASTNIIYKILKSSDVRVEVIDILGRNMQTLVNEKHTPGTYQVKFNGEIRSSGIYFYQMFVDNKIVQTRRMTLLK